MDWDYVATIQEVMEDDKDEEMQEEEEKDEEEMSESGYIGAKGPMVGLPSNGSNGCANTHRHGFARPTLI